MPRGTPVAEENTREEGADVTTRVRLAALAGTVLLGAALVAGCASSDEAKLVGRWTTQLTGYNTVAQGVTKYDQTITFGQDGTFLFQATLPGAVENAKGTWKLEKVSGAPVISISWEESAVAPAQFKYEIRGDHLLTSRVAGGMPKPEQLNVQDVDPVEYVRK